MGRYSSEFQEQYAPKGRIQVVRFTEDGFRYQYAVQTTADELVDVKLSKTSAIDFAKLAAEELKLAFNPRLDYIELYC